LSSSDSADNRRNRASSTFDRAVELLLQHDMVGFAQLWAPTGTMDFPFAAGDQPTHLDGRDAVVEYLRHYTDMVDVRDVQVHAVHTTADPDTRSTRSRRPVASSSPRAAPTGCRTSP